MTEPFELTATKALQLIDKNKLSYLEWIESCLGRIKIREPFIKAFSYIDYTRPIELAKKCDQIKKKNFGIPFAAKAAPLKLWINVPSAPSGSSCVAPNGFLGFTPSAFV